MQVFQMVRATVPTVTPHVGGPQAAAVCSRKHIPKMFILGLAAHRLVIDPKVTGNAGRTVAPDQRDQVYARHHARPGGTPACHTRATSPARSPARRACPGWCRPLPAPRPATAPTAGSPATTLRCRRVGVATGAFTHHGRASARLPVDNGRPLCSCIGQARPSDRRCSLRGCSEGHSSYISGGATMWGQRKM